MKHYWVLLCIFVSLLAIAFPQVASVQAQCQDAAGGSVPCPEDSNPNEDDDDSPDDIAAPERIPGDFDGDGTPDETDQCVEESGPDWNNGCPTDLSAPPVTESPDPTAPAAPGDFTLPQIPPDGGCMVTPSSAEAVNVRELPMPGSQVLATIEPGQTYQVIQILNNEFGTWYRVLIPSGWVSGQAVAQGGDCSNVPTVSSGIIDIAVDEVPECPPNALCVMPFNLMIGDAPLPEPPDVNFVCLENGVCIGTLTTPLPEPMCTTLGICCETLDCHVLTTWLTGDGDDGSTAAGGGGGAGKVQMRDFSAVYIPPGVMPLPEPLFLAGIGGDPTAQTREHILLARQVGMSTEDGIIPFELVLDSGEGDPEPIGLLVPAVQKVREAAGSADLTKELTGTLILFGRPENPDPLIDEALMSLAQAKDDENAAGWSSECITGTGGQKFCHCGGALSCATMLATQCSGGSKCERPPDGLPPVICTCSG